MRMLLSMMLSLGFACGDDDDSVDASTDTALMDSGNDAPDGGSDTGGSDASDAGSSDTGSSDTGSGDTGSSDTGSSDADDASTDSGPSGCRQVDVLYVVDGSGSLIAQRASLGMAFSEFVSALGAINGGVDVRVGLTDDHDSGFFVPVTWSGANPWFDSTELTPAAMDTAFSDALSQIAISPPVGVGCEHVLTSGVDLLTDDTTGFVRPGAMLVVVLVTDVDDYGAYDQLGANTCGVGCTTTPRSVAALTTALNDVKGGDTNLIAAIIAAGDPGVSGGANLCGQPGSCCGGGECSVLHATRLFEFTNLLGTRAHAGNLCDARAAATLGAAVSSTLAPTCAGM